MATIKELREKTGLTQKAFSERLNIPHRTVQNWEGGQRQCPEYVVELIAFRIEHDDTLRK
jgi:DNA-binding transcriptional regulator YiaG